MQYWLDLFTGATYEDFRTASARVSVFRESKWTTRPGGPYSPYRRHSRRVRSLRHDRST